MTESVQKAGDVAIEKASGHESHLTPDASRLTGFEPEVLAFCCEH
jgi:hypothetical protein